MSDILSTRKVGDAAVSRPQASGATTATTGTVANLPASMSTASVGTLITALVMSQNARGVATLQTDKGALLLQTNLPLKAGSELVLQLQTTGAQNRFLILSVDHQPLAGAIAGQARTAPAPREPGARIPLLQEGADGANAARISTKSLQAGNTGRPAAAGPAVTSPGNRLDARTATAPSALSVRGPLTAGLLVPARVLTETAQTAPVPAPSGQAASSLARPFNPGNQLTIRILALAGPGNEMLSPSAPAVQTGSTPVQGIVQAPSGSPGHPATTEIVVPAGKLAIDVIPPPAPGSRLLFEILAAGPKAMATGHAAADPLEFLRIGSNWASLKEAIAAVQSSGGEGTPAQPALMAEPGSRMASTMLFFMSALRSGDVMSWLGQHHAEDLAQSGRSLLVGQLADEFAAMSRHTAEGQATGWHAFVVPFGVGSHVDLARVHYRRRKGPGADDSDGDATHFVVEAELSRVGLFRLEGLVRTRQFDLAVRSARELSLTVRDGIRDIFQDALNTGNLAGTIRFQTEILTPFNPAGGAPAAATAQSTAIIV